MHTAVLDITTKVIVNPHRGKCAPQAGFYMASLRQSGIIWMQPLLRSLVDESTASKLRKIYIRELALISPIRQLLTPFSAEGGIRLPRYRVMRQQPSFAQAHWFLSIVSIKSDAVRLALVEKCCDCYLSGRSEKVRELRIGFCTVISRIHRADCMEKLASCFTKIR